MTNSKINTYNTAFVLGNGQSRKEIDLELLKSKGLLVGCNKIYTEIEPHIICALDEPMRKEILSQNLNSSFIGSNTEVYFDKICQRDMCRQNFDYAYINKEIDLSNAIQHYPSFQGMNSGLLALAITSYIENINKIYLLGFDFHHNSNEPKNNNLYNSDTTSRPKGYEVQLNQVFNFCNKNTQIFIVKQDGDEEFHKLLKVDGFLDYDQFGGLIN